LAMSRSTRSTVHGSFNPSKCRYNSLLSNALLPGSTCAGVPLTHRNV
jgi:hypothetical protein